MAQINSTTFGRFKIELGDGQTPTEGFTIVAGLTSKGLQYDTETVTTEAPDATNEDLPSYKEQGIKAYGITFSGSGMWAAESHKMLTDWWKSGAPKNARITYMDAPAGSIQKFTGPAVLTSLEHSTSKGGKLEGSIGIGFAAMPTFVNA